MATRDVVKVVEVRNADAITCVDLLSEDEQRRAQRLHQRARWASFVAGRAALRVILGRLLGIAPRDVPIKEGLFGKPELKGGGPYFNLSHTQSLLAVAVREAGPVGIDIETVTRRTPRSEVVRRTLTEAERKELNKLPTNRAKNAFLELWCRKEAYAKGLSTGLGLDFGRIHVGSGDMLIAGDPPWEVRSLHLPHPHCGAVAASGQGWLVKRNPMPW